MIGVLLLGMGGPDALDDVEPYLKNVRHGRPFSKQFLEDLRRKYALIGGRSPLADASRRQAAALQAELVRRGLKARVEAGMRYWKPYAKDALGRLLEDGAERVIALCLTPQESTWSTGGYRQSFEEAAEALRPGLPRRFVPDWHREPGFLEAAAERVRTALASLKRPGSRRLVFTAHSLPVRFAEPYVTHLKETAEAVAALVDVRAEPLAFQSQSPTGEPWLGPDVGQVLERLAAEKAAGVVVAPIGFISDHLEVLYDLDILYAGKARAFGLEFARAAVVGDHPSLIGAWAGLVEREAGAFA